MTSKKYVSKKKQLHVRLLYESCPLWQTSFWCLCILCHLFLIATNTFVSSTIRLLYVYMEKIASQKNILTYGDGDRWSSAIAYVWKISEMEISNAASKVDYWYLSNIDQHVCMNVDDYYFRTSSNNTHFFSFFCVIFSLSTFLLTTTLNQSISHFDFYWSTNICVGQRF